MSRFLVLLLVLLTGCGGGTASTGDSGARSTKVVLGRILDRSDNALAAVTVRDRLSETQALSDQSGAFELNAVCAANRIELAFETDELSENISLADIPESSNTIIADFKLDDEQGLLSLVSIEYATEESTAQYKIENSDSTSNSLSQEAPKKAKPKHASSPKPQPPKPAAATAQAQPQTGTSQAIHRIHWQGRVVDSTGTPAGGVDISLSSGEKDTTDSNGRFSIESDSQDSPFSVKITYKCKSALISLGTLPTDVDSTVRLKLSLKSTPSDITLSCQTVGGQLQNLNNLQSNSLGSLNGSMQGGGASANTAFVTLTDLKVE